MTGDTLTQAIRTPPPPPIPLITDFLYPRTVLMITGEAGKGKTVIGTQMALSLSSHASLFGQLHIPTPKRVYFLQAEGSWEGQLRRLHLMNTVVPVNGQYLYWDAQHTHRVYALNRSSVDRKLKEIETAFAPHPPEVIFLDPIYKVAGGDLARAEPALALVEFSDRLLHEFGATVVFMHHPHRERWDNQHHKIEEDDAYYGHSFLRNHVEFAYFFKQTSPDGLYSELKVTKRREEDVRTSIQLCYHPETYSCSMEVQPSEVNLTEQVRHFLQQKALNGGTTTFKEIQHFIPIRHSYLRELQGIFVKEGWLTLHTTPGKPTIWTPLPRATPSQ